MQVAKGMLHDQENVILKDCLIIFQPVCVFSEADTGQNRVANNS